MDRPSVRHGIILALVLAAALLPAAGCRTLMVTAIYLLKGNDVDPDFPGLKGKKVAVVCRPLVTLQYRNADVARDLAQQVTLLLQKTGAQDSRRSTSARWPSGPTRTRGRSTPRWARP